MRHKETSISTLINHLSDTEEKWFAIYTKYKCEKYVAEHLGKKGIAAYVPLYTKVSKYKSGIKKRSVPLVNCYVFVKITKSDYVRVLESDYVLGFIKQRKNIISIPEHEIDMLKMVVGEMEHVDASQIIYERGDLVEIIGGNLTGIRGKLVDREGNHRFVVHLETIGLQLEMVIDKTNLRLVEKRA